jgi:S1-C subfamily serine protease
MRTSVFAAGSKQGVQIFSVFVCALAGGNPGLTPTPAQEAPSPSRLGPLSAVVQLVAVGPAARGNDEECTGTGFFVNDEGAILTNAHVVEEGRRCLEGAPGAKILAKFAGPDPNTAEAISCDVVGIDESHDLAVLKTELAPARLRYGGPQETARGVGDAYLTLDPGEVPPGAQVNVTGHTGRTWQAATLGGHVIERKSLILLQSSSEPSDVMVLDIPLKRGASGSPVYLQNGRVICVVAETDPSNPARTIAVASRYAIALLERLHISYRLPLTP